MKILFVIDKFPTVSETFVLDQVVGLIDKGHDVRLISWSSKGDSIHSKYDKYRFNDRIIEMRPLVPRSVFMRYIMAIRSLTKLMVFCPKKFISLFSLKYRKISYGLIPHYVANALYHIKWKADVVVSHFGTNGLIVSSLKNAGFISKDTSCYTFFHAYEISGDSIAETHKKYKQLILDGSIFLPISKMWYNKLISAGASPKNVVLCHMGVDLTKITFKLPKFDKYNLNIISVGRLIEKKAHEYSIKAIAQLIKETKYNIQFNIIGYGPLQSKLESLIKEMKMEEHIHLKGGMSHDDVMRILDSSDIFLLPSITSSSGDMEGIPVSLMEAMAKGLICVSTFHSGIPELIEDRVTGYLCRESNVKDIVDSLSEILSESQTKLSAISLAAREKVKREFNQDKLLDDFINIISKNTFS